MKFSRPSKKMLIVSSALVVLTSIVAFALNSQGRMTVEVVNVEIGSVKDLVEETAVVKARNQRIMEAEVSGTLEQILVEPGDHVSEGDLLAVLGIMDVDLEIAQLEAQRASLAAELAEAQRIDANTLAQLEAEKTSAYAAYETAERAYNQNRRLHESGAMSTSALSDSKDQMTMALAAYESANHAYLQEKSGLSQAMQEKYKAELNVLDYKIKSIENKRHKFEIRAPFEGVITEKRVETKDVLAMGTPILEIVDEGSKYLETDVLASDAGKLKEGTKVIVTDDDIGIDATGLITKVFPKAFSKTSDLGIEQKRVRVEMGLKESMETLKLGYEIDVDVLLEEQKAELRIPDTAAFKINKEWHVFVVKDQHLEVRPVKIGLEGQDYFEVKSGLEAGEQVVVSPENELEAGERVSIEINEG